MALTNIGTAQSPNDAVRKAYVDLANAFLSTKTSVKCATTGNIALSGTPVIDGVGTDQNVPDRVLVKDQTNPAQNGIYTVSSGAWQRASDSSQWDMLAGALVSIQQGTVNKESLWLCTIDKGAGDMFFGASDPVTWSRVAGTNTASRFSSATHAAGTTITLPQTMHNLRASMALMVQCQDNATGKVEYPDIVIAVGGDVTVTYGSSVAANSKRITVIG
jgi:hypothetical protein